MSPEAPSGDEARAEENARRLLARDHLLRAPFAALRASFFHAALEVPPLQSGRTLPRGTVYARLEASHVRSVERRDIHGFENSFDGLFDEWAALKVSWGILSRLELGGRLAYSGWYETLDKFSILNKKGEPIVRNEVGPVTGIGPSSKRHENVSDFVLEAKGLILKSEDCGLDLSLAISEKLPIARERDLTNAGTTDVNVTLLGSVPLGRLTLHGNFGVGVPLGEQNLFVEEENVELDPFLHGGAAATVVVWDGLAAVVQIEANTSAFGDVRFLDGPPVTLFAGLRKLFGDIVLEAGGGLGLVQRSSYDYQVYVALGYLF